MAAGTAVVVLQSEQMIGLALVGSLAAEAQELVRPVGVAAGQAVVELGPDTEAAHTAEQIADNRFELELAAGTEVVVPQAVGMRLGLAVQPGLALLVELQRQRQFAVPSA